MPFLITSLYLVAAILGAAFAAAEIRLLYRFLKHRTAIRDAVGSKPSTGSGNGSGPHATVTIQLPLYNERTAAEQVIQAAARQEYPLDRFDIQVLDDSTDETVDIVAHLVGTLREQGVRIDHIRRDHRSGYKAGAMAEGLERTDAEFVAVFDADFTPDPEFLRKVLVEEAAFEDPDVAFVQTRWAWAGPVQGLFYSALALLLDRHFFIQKPTRAYIGNVTTFNGSGGVWRRAAIEAAGGWSADTLTEDLDLSYRVALGGWHGKYLRDVSVASELPSHMRAFKVQQRRWARGTAQCLVKLTRRVMSSPGKIREPWEEAALLAGYAIHPILAANLLLWPWAVLYMDRVVFWVLQGVLAVATMAAPFSFLITVRERGDRWTVKSLSQVLAGLCIGIGLMVNNTVGQMQGIFTNEGEFARTPKAALGSGTEALAGLGADRPYGSPLHWTVFLELLVIAYCLVASAVLISRGEALWAIPLLFWALCVGLVVQLQFAPLTTREVP